MTDALPILLPTSALPQASSSTQWTPKRHLLPPQKPPIDELKEQQETTRALVRRAVEGKMIKRTRPRRTVDYGAGMGRWILVRRIVFYQSRIYNLTSDCF